MDWLSSWLSVKTRSVLQVSMITSSLVRNPPSGSLTACPDAQLSCHNTTAADTCCLSFPGGRLIQTQFWDSNPTAGPQDSWTIHGLWPDLCDGGYEAYCDRSRDYRNITAILKAGSEEYLLPYMEQYWKNDHGDDQELWSHEWSKHGTCISTLDIRCYSSYRSQEEVVDYFKVAVELFKSLPTYQVLAAAGVVPSSSRTWTIEEIEAPLKAMHAGDLAVRCRGKVLSEVWYYFSVRGPVQNGKFFAADGNGMKSSCPGTGIRYLPKSLPGSSSTSTDPTTSSHIAPIPSPTSAPSPFTDQGFLHVRLKGKKNIQGCLISEGWWYTSGTCARFHVQNDVLDHGQDKDHGQKKSRAFTLTSSKGHCGIVDDEFRCTKKLPYQTIFGSANNGTLSFQKSAVFYARRIPARFDKVEISATKPSAIEGLEVEVVWSPAADYLVLQN